jgi:hypothetical protein
MIQGGESFRLIVRRGPQPNQVYELTKEIVTIGRDITNEIVINDPEVSRHHLRLTRGAGGFTLEDLGSTNGTFVNGQRLTGARPLRSGELIGLGETVTLSYEVLQGAGAANTMPNVGAEPSRYVPPPGVQPNIAQPPSYAPQPSPQPYEGQPPGYVPFAPPGQVGAANPPPSSPPTPRYAAAPEPRLSPEGQPIYPGMGGNVPPSSPGYPGSGYGSSAPSSSAVPGNIPGSMPGGAPIAPPGFGSDYDPYAVREEDTRNTTRYILLGCGGLAVFCCCATGLGAIAVDQLCLWDRIPIVYDVLRAFGLVISASC